MLENNTQFYSKLDLNDLPISQLLAKRDRFKDLPGNWHVLVADIRNSTAAIEKGQHNEVNLIATGCVIAVLNLAEDIGIRVPFFFGGDGVTFLIPEEMLSSSLTVLEKHNENSLKNFNFSLTIGSCSVKEIYDRNIQLKIARVKINKQLNIPVILGSGLQVAEDYIKEQNQSHTINRNMAVLNLKGMECKWDKVKPPGKDHEIISLIVTGIGDGDFAEIYSDIMAKIDSIYGSIRKRKPISVDKLKIKAGLQRINDELRIKEGKWSLLHFIRNWFINNFGEIYLKNTITGKGYLKRLVELSDNLSLDGRINTVMTGKPEQREKLITYLNGLEKEGVIKYGYHISQESIMSCYVKDIRSRQHIHFVDGGSGGYTKAANLLKSKFEG